MSLTLCKCPNPQLWACHCLLIHVSWRCRLLKRGCHDLGGSFVEVSVSNLARKTIRIHVEVLLRLVRNQKRGSGAESQVMWLRVFS